MLSEDFVIVHFLLFD